MATFSMHTTSPTRLVGPPRHAQRRLGRRELRCSASEDGQAEEHSLGPDPEAKYKRQAAIGRPTRHGRDTRLGRPWRGLGRRMLPSKASLRAQYGPASARPAFTSARCQRRRAPPGTRRYGAHFGQRFFLRDLVESAPRVRTRCAADRARDQLADLAVLNARLAGGDEAATAAVRQRLEYLKRRRREWEAVYQLVTRQDALCTLAAIEDANRKASIMRA